MAEGRGKRDSAGEAIEAILANEDSNDETFDCGYDLDIIPDSENEGDSQSSDLDTQTEGLRLQQSNKAECLTGMNCNKITLNTLNNSTKFILNTLQ